MADLLAEESGLAARAQTLQERLSALGHDVEAGADPSFAATLRLARWRSAAAGGDAGRFARMLEQRGIGLGLALRAVENVPRSRAVDAAWVLDLHLWLDAAAIAAQGTAPAWVGSDGLPESEILWPLVIACEAGLAARSTAPMLRRPAIRGTLQRMLARWIGHIAAGAIAEQREGGASLELGALMSGYPAMARLLAVVAANWSAAMVEFAQRCEEDLGLLADSFGDGNPLGPPVDVTLDLSDPHNGLRTVAAVTFEGGRRLVYKPRPLAMDTAFATLLETLNATGALPDLRAPRTLERPGYGWCEWVESHLLADAAEWDALARRTGALLAVVFMLEGVDVHDENIVFVGGHPVIVDAETMLHPRYWLVPQPARLEAGARLAWSGLQDSVRRTLMVSEWRRGGGTWIDSAAISALAACWRSAGRDPVELVACVTGGFEAGMQGLALLGQDPATVDRLLAPFADCRSRIVLRATGRYHETLVESLKAACLRDGIERSLVLERLAAEVTSANGIRLPPALLHAEIEALSQGEIPYVTGAVAEDEIGGQTGLAGTPSLRQVRSNLREAGQAVDEQVRILEGSLRAHLAPLPCALSGADGPVSDAVIRAAALGIADALAEAIVVADDGSFGAVGISRDPDSERHQFMPLSRGLYRGTIGIGLLFAACGRVGGRACLATLPGGIAMALRTQVEHQREVLASPALGKLFGTFTAATSEVIYGCLRIAFILEDRDLISAVHAAAVEQAELRSPPCDRSGAAALALYRCGEALGDERLLAEATRRARTMAGRINREFAGHLAQRDPAALALFLQLLAVVARAEADAALLAQARELTAALPEQPFHAPSTLLRHRLGLPATLPPRPVADDSLERGGAGWLELALAGQGGEAPRAAGAMIRAATVHGGYALASGRCRRALCLAMSDGLAGIGYQLLRVLYPAELPSILLMD